MNHCEIKGHSWCSAQGMGSVWHTAPCWLMVLYAWLLVTVPSAPQVSLFPVALPLHWKPSGLPFCCPHQSRVTQFGFRGSTTRHNLANWNYFPKPPAGIFPPAGAIFTLVPVPSAHGQLSCHWGAPHVECLFSFSLPIKTLPVFRDRA